MNWEDLRPGSAKAEWPAFLRVSDGYAPVGEVSLEMARRMEAMMIALRNVRDKDGLRVRLDVPWAAIHAMAEAALAPEAAFEKYLGITP